MLDQLRPLLPEVTLSAPEAPASLLAPDAAVTAYVLLIPDGGAWPSAARGRTAALGLPVAELESALEAPKPMSASAPTPVAGAVGLVVLAGIGDGSAHQARLAAAAAARAVPKATAVIMDGPDDLPLDAVIEGLILGSAKPVKWLAAGPSAERTLRQIILLGIRDDRAVQAGRDGAAVTLLARALGATPSNIKNPAWLAAISEQAAVAGELTITVWDETELAERGFGGILAVGGGSNTPPRLVQLDYDPDGTGAPPVVLVGKGITFDTGGLDIKPPTNMVLMKTDMSGAAAVLSVLAHCREAGVRRRVIGLLPLAENAVGPAAYRPSDVITSFGGRTVEIVNTDAEGRIVLADAIAYAVAELDPDVVVDIATLTGAARIALGTTMAASFGTDPGVLGALRLAFAEAGEHLWPLPLVSDYRPALDSPVADIAQMGPLGKPAGGAIMAALFLQEFAGEVPWVHLDIAGPGRSETDTGIVHVGATGYGARGLLRWLTKE
ncbi:MAG: M17 family metallopeptidase [Tetrasphaera sp.]